MIKFKFWQRRTYIDGMWPKLLCFICGSHKKAIIHAIRLRGSVRARNVGKGMDD